MLENKAYVNNYYSLEYGSFWSTLYNEDAKTCLIGSDLAAQVPEVIMRINIDNMSQ